MIARADRVLLAAFVIAAAVLIPQGTLAVPDPIRLGFLGTEFINDNEAYEPTSDAERARVVAVENILKSRLSQSPGFELLTVPPDMKAAIDAGQPLGACGGCELDYGRLLGADQVAWIRIQKVSNLILNMNVYMADVAAEKMTFVRSVDIRGNTDDTWRNAINWLIKNYLLPEAT